uniref:Uncharacterized protein n=1 Tax=Spironucleus salmonicida TaxID=348837 RepID=V6LJ94_9EUKA|eukprot:EST43761.1 Hypothetical protein SS50377_16500 [Spironucleus salmonicida]
MYAKISQSTASLRKKCLPPLNSSQPKLLSYISEHVSSPIVTRCRSQSRDLELSDCQQDYDFTEKSILLLRNFILQ